MAHSVVLTKEDCPAALSKEQVYMSTQPYRGVIGTLLYASLGARPDISFPVAALARFSINPARAHFTAAKRVIRYLLATATKGVQYSPCSETSVELFSDSDWGSNIDDRKSVSGYVLVMAGAPVSWCSRRQKTTALSSTEAEFLALSDALKEALWIRMLLTEMGVNFSSPIIIRVDNHAAIALSKNAVHHQRSKHIDIRYFRIRDEIANGNVSVIYVPTWENISDLLTKAPTRVPFFNNIKALVR
jgi:hypothetical protein